MKPRSTLCCILVFLSAIPDRDIAQGVVFRYSDSSLSKRISPVEGSLILHSAGANGYSCVVLRTAGGALTYLLVDPDFRLVRKIEQQWSAPTNLFLAERARPLGAPVYKDSAFHYYFIISPPYLPDRVFEKVIDFRTGAISEKQCLALPGRKYIMGYFLGGERRLCVIAMQPHGDTLEFYRQADEGLFDEANLDVSRINQPDDYFGLIHFVPEDAPQQLENLTARTLAYVRGNQLVLFTHHADAPLQVTIIDLNSFQAHFKELLPDPGGAIAPGDSTVERMEHFTVASAVADDKVFQVRAFQGRMELDIFHIPDMKRLRHFTWTSSRPPLFTADPHTLGINSFRKETNEKSTFDRYLNALRDGPLGIAVNRTDSGGYQLTIGRYNDPQDRYDAFGHPIFHAGEGAGSSMPAKRIAGSGGGATPVMIGTGVLVSELLTDRHTASFDPGRFDFTATIAKIDVDVHSLANIRGSDLRLGDTHLSGFMEAEAKKNGGASFVSGGKCFSGAYDKDAGAFIIREIPVNSP
jgi:hypothetical protein